MREERRARGTEQGKNRRTMGRISAGTRGNRTEKRGGLDYPDRRLSKRRKGTRGQRERRLYGAIAAIAATLFLCTAASLLLCSFLSVAQNQEKEVLYKYYTSVMVRPGDNLWSLAEQYSDGYASAESYVREVIRVNHLFQEEVRAGEYLILPYYSSEFK